MLTDDAGDISRARRGWFESILTRLGEGIIAVDREGRVDFMNPAAEALTGHTPAGGDQELLTDDPRGLPTFGSAVSFALGSRANVLPYVALPYTLYNVVQLPGQTPRSGAQRCAQRKFPLPRRGLPNHQVRHIDDGDQQDHQGAILQTAPKLPRLSRSPCGRHGFAGDGLPNHLL